MLRVLRWLEQHGKVMAVGAKVGAGGVRYTSDGYVLVRP